MLIQRLRELETAGLVIRDAQEQPELRTDYRLSAEGESLAPVLQAMYDWGLQWAARDGIKVGTEAYSGSRFDLASSTLDLQRSVRRRWS
jgi:DNA-binding HxlR family transcriptional regulator